MATATLEKPAAKKSALKPLMKFRLLAGGLDQIDPAFRGLGTIELRNRVLQKRGVDAMDEVDAAAEQRAVDQLSKPELLKELGARQRFRADNATGHQPEVLSEVDLEKKFGRHRYARVNDDGRQGGAERVVEKIVEVEKVVTRYFDPNDASEDELRAYAAEEEIALDGCDSRDKVLKAIKSARKTK